MLRNESRVIQFILPLLILASFLLSYQGQLAHLTRRWHGGDNDYCLLIIPLFLYLLWERRADFCFRDFSWSWTGVVIALFSSMLIMAGEFGSVETLTYLGFWVAAVGLICLLYGGRTSRLIFPIIILAFIIPQPPYINRLLTFQLKMYSSSLSVVLLRLFNVSVMQDGNIIDLGISQLQVADACSGLRYFMPMLLMSLIVGHLINKSFWQKAVLISLVVPLSILINGIRIFVAGMFTVNGHEEMVTNFFHDFSGWLGFMIVAGLLALFAILLKKSGRRRRVERKKSCYAVPSRPGLTRPVLLSLILCLLFIGTSWVVTQGNVARRIPERQSFANFPMRIGDWQGKRSYLSANILKSLRADDYVQAYYRNAAQHSAIYLLIPYYRYQGTRHTAHTPQSCLLGGGFYMQSSQKRTVKVAPHKVIQVMAMKMEKGGRKVLASYFFLERGRVVTSPWLNKFYLMWDSFTKGRTDGALVRVELQMSDSMSYEKAGSELDAFIRKLWPHLISYVPS
ncbi:VPLPA-CTERM-specific exosortase XrtD [Desulfobacterota bacterium M19]